MHGPHYDLSRALALAAALAIPLTVALALAWWAVITYTNNFRPYAPRDRWRVPFVGDIQPHHGYIGIAVAVAAVAWFFVDPGWWPLAAATVGWSMIIDDIVEHLTERPGVPNSGRSAWRWLYSRTLYPILHRRGWVE